MNIASTDYAATTLLHRDERFELWRGRRLRTGAPVLLKRAHAAAALAALQREAALLAALPGNAALQPRLVERDTLLVFEDRGGALLATQAPLPLHAALAVGRQLAALLGELHRQGRLHLGLRPDAVLCDPAQPRAWLVDAADARAPDAADAPLPLAAARLAYASPEQTGRTARGVDARSDLYALGLLLYELLAGAPPLRSDDALELLHWQLAGAAPPLPPSVPAPLAEIVARLLAKAPDERYQSAAGVEHDLAQCERAWREHGAIAPFGLGRRDGAARLAPAARLYGREAEVERLRAAFERACAGGGAQLLVVGGPAGVGKTALIQQRVKPIARERGYYTGGKFDQLVQGTPFGALIQALRGLVLQLLTESEERLARWRATLAAALGREGGVLAEVIPEIEFVVGAQPAAPALGPAETQNRFRRVFHDFVAALATAAHPLVLFLDDLQWADAATLGLLEPLLASSEIAALLVIGTVRDNDLGPGHRLAQTLAAIEARGLALERIALGPLQASELDRLVGDALRRAPEEAAPLARLVEAKTGGNPFFVVQFLKTLERDGLFRWDEASAGWSYDIDAIARAPLADDVVDLMTRDIRRLPSRCQYALTLAACIGSRFDTATLATVSEQSREGTEQDLACAIDAGLLLRARRPGDGADAPVYDFLHDRVQQAAYALIPEPRRRMVHLTVGRLLHAGATPEQADARLFDIAHHLNLGAALIHDPAERLALAELDLAAGCRAQASTAYEAARALLDAGLALLDDAAWTSRYELAFALHLEAAESHYLCGRFDSAERLQEQLLERAATPEHRARAARMRSVQYENLGRYGEALASALDSLAMLGVTFPRDAAAQEAALDAEIAAIDARLAGRDIATLIDLPPLRDTRVQLVTSTLTDIWASAFIIGQPTLARLFSATLVRLSLEHGHADDSAYGYVTHAITVGPLRGDYARAHAFGRLALALDARLPGSRRRAKVYQQFHAHVSLWCEPWPDCLAYAREACRAGLASGDFLYGAYGAGTEPWTAIAATQDLAQFERDYAPTVALLEKLRNSGFADSVKLMLNWARALRGATRHPLSLSDASLDEDAYLAAHRDNPFFAAIRAVCRLQLCVLLGDARQALAAAHEADVAQHLPGTVWPVLQAYWSALAWADAVDDDGGDGARDGSGATREQALAEVSRALSLFDTLAVHCPYNFRAQALLLAGAAARLRGDAALARREHERSIEFAAQHGLLQHQAIACERAARVRLADGEPRIALLLLAEAQRCYAQWGASAKARALEREHPELASAAGEPLPAAIDAAQASDRTASAPPQDSGAGLDLGSLLKAAQALAGEVELPRLLARLMHIAIENAGAERGALVLEGDGGPQVYGSEALAEPVPLARAANVPMGIVNVVRRTGASVVLADAPADDRHGTDPYIVREQPRSVLCVPVQQLGRLVGALYLESRLIAGAFGAERIRVMQVIASEAAGALENARLVAGLRDEIAERRAAQEQLGRALAEVQRLQQDLEAENRLLRRDLIANVSHDLRTPLVSLRGYLEVLDAKGEALPAEQRRSYLQIALRQSERLSTLIDELFELAKLDFKGMQVQREPFALPDLASDVLQKFQLAAAARQVALALDAAPALPSAHADLGLIERVLDNLVGNALRHTGAGGRVAIAISAAPGALRLRVIDTGCGIAAADLPHVFDRYWRGGGGGAGLGLAITQRILELHGCVITVESEPGRGSCFEFRLPAAA